MRKKLWVAPVLGVLKARDTTLNFGGAYQDFTSSSDEVYNTCATPAAPYCS